jgi:selenoprotein W-related protein
LTEQLLTEYKQRIRQLSLAPFDDGRFEVFVDGKKIYSKKATGRFPEYNEVKAALEKQAA